MSSSLRRDRGASDPLLIIAGIAISLTLLIGGSFAVVDFMRNTQDRSARDDLARIATSQAAYHSENDRYADLAVGPDIPKAKQDTELIDGKVGYKNQNNANIVVTANKGGWTAVTQSRSGKVFVRSSFDRKTYEVQGAPGPAPEALGPEKLLRTNLAMYPDGYYSKPDTLSEFGIEESRSTNHGSYRNIIDATDGPGIDGLTSYLRWSGNTGATKTSQYGFNLSGNPQSTAPASALASPPVGTVTISLFVRSSVDTTAQIRLRAASATGWSGAATTGPWTTLPAGQWTQVSRTITTTAAGPRLSAAVLTSGSIGPGDTLDATGLLVENASDVQTYIDGGSFDLATVRTAWKGEAHRSMSEQYFRDITGDQKVWRPSAKPEGLQLPSGISWSDVKEDLMQVKR